MAQRSARTQQSAVDLQESDHGRYRSAPFDEGFGKTGFARRLLLLRFRRLRLSQVAFAERYGVGYSMVKAVEQGRAPSKAFVSLVAAIERDPVMVASAVRNASAPHR